MMITNLPNTKSLKIILWNANGLKQNEPELLHLLIQSKIDIALITETHYTSNTNHFFPGFQVYRADHPDGTAHAGSAILVSNQIQHYPLQSLQLPSIQATNIQIVLNHIPTTLSSVYCPPLPAITPPQIENFLKSLGRSFIAGGDFNAKNTQWGSRLTNSRGRLFLDNIQKLGGSFISPSGPTYWPTHTNRQPDILDFFLTSIPKHIRHKIQNSCEISSDHTPVILEINGSMTCKPPRPSLVKGPVNWEKFSTILENNTNLKISLKNTDEIEKASQDFVNSIKAAISNSSYTPNPNKPPNSNQYDLPLYIKALIIEKRRARSRWQHTRLPSDKKIYNHLSNTIKTKIRIHKSELFKQKYESLCSKDGSLWRTTKNILKIKDQPFHLKKADGTLAFSDIDKANTFGKHLSEIFTPHHDITPEPSHLKQITNFLISPLPMSLPTKHTSPNEIKNLIQKLKIKKSPGHDQITNKILQHLPKKSIILLTYIFNSMLRMSYFPLIWKLSVIILIHKPNKPKNEPSSYRPISLLPVLGKLFEKVMLKRIRPILKSHNIIPNTQFGFRENHSTTHQIHRIVDKIASSFETKNFCPGVFLDVSQAFDRVWHTGLLFKLKMFLPAPLYLLTKSYLQNRSFIVRQEDSLSSQFQILAGVPQGSDLSPDLYNIYTADIPNSENTLIATYADDTAILSSHSDSTTAYQNLQIHLDNISKWSIKWRIKINTDKSFHIPFTLRKAVLPPIYFQNNPIQTTTQTKYLGLILDKRLTWGPHLKIKRKTLNTRLHLLRPILKSKISIENKLLIYKSMLKPIWAYGIQIWGCAKPSQIRTIQAFQSISLRLITSAPWYVSNLSLHKDLKIETVSQTAKKYYKNLHTKTTNHTNPLISNLASEFMPNNPPRRLKRHWCRDLLNPDPN